MRTRPTILPALMTVTMFTALTHPSDTRALSVFPILSPMATSGGSMIQSDFKSGANGDFELAVMQGSPPGSVQSSWLVHYWHDNSNPLYAWHRGQVISKLATGIGPCSLIQSTLGTGSHKNFELVVWEGGFGGSLVRYTHDNSNRAGPWQRMETIATGVAGPGAIIQSSFGASQATRNFEVVVPIRKSPTSTSAKLTHFWHDNSNPSSPWHQGLDITAPATNVSGAACLIQSTFGTEFGFPGNFEVVVPQGGTSSGPGTQLAHYWLNNANPLASWLFSEYVRIESSAIIGAASMIQSTFGTELGFHGNFEVVVPLGTNLRHFYFDNSGLGGPAWQLSPLVVATSVSGPASIIQSDFGSGVHKNFEVVVENEKATAQIGAKLSNTTGPDQNLVHYFYDNTNLPNTWYRGQIVTFRGRSQKVCQLTGEQDRERQQPTTNLTQSRFTLLGTDLGYPVEFNNRLYFLFGDSNGATDPHNPYLESGADDSLAYSTDTAPPSDGGACTGLTFNTSSSAPKQFQSPTYISSPGIDQGLFNVPASGFSANGNLFSFFWTNHCFPNDDDPQNPNACHTPNARNPARSDPAANLVGNAVLGYSTASDNGRTFASSFQGPTPPYPFAVVSSSVSTAGIPGLPPELQNVVLIYGVPCYRLSTPYLAKAPLSSPGDISSWRYYTASGTWSADVTQATTVFAPSSEQLSGNSLFNACMVNSAPVTGCIGEMSITYNATLQKWLMLYNCSDPGPVPNWCYQNTVPEDGIRVRVADSPTGPWSNPKTIFNPDNNCGDHGWCHFMHGLSNWPDLTSPSCDNVSEDPNNSLGGPYAPYTISRFSSVTVPPPSGTTKAVRIYYTMSTWNPYQVVIMQSDLAIQ